MSAGEGSTTFMLNWNREDKLERGWGSLPHVWQVLLGTDTSLTELGGLQCSKTRSYDHKNGPSGYSGKAEGERKM